MMDLDFGSLVADLGLHQRRKVVSALLAGNDTQCFSTQQYAAAYHRVAHNDDPKHRERWIEWLVKLAPKHLQSLGMREVSPGVWAAAAGDAPPG